MIDFIKIEVQNADIQKIKDNPLLEWMQTTNERTGEVKEYTSFYHGLTFVIKNNQYLNISGSLHKHWNSATGNGEQNYNDFTFKDLTGVIIQFCKSFELSPESCKLANLEFGVNVSPCIHANEILRSVINHKGKPFTQEYSENKRFRECERQRYIIKIYNKGLQYNQPGIILRFENKTIKMEHLKGTGITTLKDLLDPVKIERLGVILTDNFNELLLYDYTIPCKGLSASKCLILSQGQSPSYWMNLLESNPNNYYKKQKRFKDLVRKHGTRDLYEIVGTLIPQKWNELLSSNPKTLQELTDPSKDDITGINRSDKGLKPVKFTNRDQSSGPTHAGDISGIGNQGAGPLHRYCLSCGKDISHQRTNSKFCSPKYVGEQTAHRCRNIDSNPRNRMKYLIKREGESLTLFNTIPFFNIQRPVLTSKN